MIKFMEKHRKNWGNENTQPECELLETVYRSMKESCMMLENNKKVHNDVRQELVNQYRE